MAKNSTIASPSSDYKITYTGNNDLGNLDPTTDTGTEYTFNRDYQYDNYNVGSQQETYQVQVTDNAGLQTNNDLSITINNLEN